MQRECLFLELCTKRAVLQTGLPGGGCQEIEGGWERERETEGQDNKREGMVLPVPAGTVSPSLI